MKRLLFTFMLGSLVACVNQAETSKISIPPQVVPPTTYQTVDLHWDSANTPLQMRISQNFSADEKQKMEDMQSEWNNSGTQLTFFATSSTAVANKAPANLQDFYDDELGIYKMSTWYSEIGASSLAVTQFFAIRRNVGTATEFMEIIHADILFNDQNFDFATDGSPGKYDLPSIALHELGHVLGLKHESSLSSIMYPYLATATLHRTLPALDIDNIRDLYGASRSALSVSTHALQSLPPLEGSMVRGIIEVKTDGSEEIYFK